MKITLTEFDGVFAFSLQAETMVDAALLTRLGVNTTKELRHISAVVDRNGNFTASVVVGKHKLANNYLPKRR